MLASSSPRATAGTTSAARPGSAYFTTGVIAAHDVSSTLAELAQTRATSSTSISGICRSAPEPPGFTGKARPSSLCVRRDPLGGDLPDDGTERGKVAHGAFS